MGSTPTSSAPHSLVILCCHAIFHGSDPLNEAHWALAPFQKSTGAKPGEHIIFLEHMHAALSHQIASSSTVVFSGGPTKPDYPSLSEAQSYLNAARACGRYSVPTLDAVLIEKRATDLYQNLLFSLLEFSRVHGAWPDDIVVVSHDFKRERLQLHRRAIRWIRPFTVEGIDPPFEGKWPMLVIVLSSFRGIIR
jgi:hypothetical protein